MSKRILIAGCGYVGIPLAHFLAQAGHQVWGVRRSQPTTKHPFTTIQADLLTTDWAWLPADIDVIYYLASPSGYDTESYRAIYCEGLERLLQALEGEPRVALATSTGVYGQHDGEWVDESSETAPLRETARQLLRAEQLLADAPQTTTAVRFSGIYGPGRTRLIDQVRNGEARLSAAPHWTNRIHQHDCAGFLAHLADQDTWHPCYIATDDAPATKNEVLSWIAQTIGCAEPPVGEQLSQRVVALNKRCRNQRMRESGYSLRYPTFKEGYAELID